MHMLIVLIILENIEEPNGFLVSSKCEGEPNAQCYAKCLWGLSVT